MRLLALLLAVAAPAPLPALGQMPPAATTASDVGVLVMAHGGTPEWDRAVREAVQPLAGRVPTAVAFGMADRQALASALDSLRQAGAGRVAVVRMFVSGASFLDQTLYFLGLSEQPPAVFIGHADHDVDAGSVAPAPIAHGLEVATHWVGLMGSAEVAQILAARAAALSGAPERESVLLVAHGMATDEENAAVIAAMRAAADVIAGRGFARTDVATLREDWPEQRVDEEARIRAFVRDETVAGRRVLVLPYRLHGFGPYADVLAGESYAAGEALIPHAAVTDWIRGRAAEIARAEGWGDPFADWPR
jgi:hypothetical protein